MIRKSNSRRPRTQEAPQEPGVIKLNVSLSRTDAEMLLAAQEAGRGIVLKVDPRLIVGDEIADKMTAVVNAPDEATFCEMIEIARINKARTFIGTDLRGIKNLGDLTGFNFTRTDFSGTDFDGATNIHKAISFVDAKIDGCFMTTAQHRQLKEQGAVGKPVIRPAASQKTPQPESKPN